MATKTAPIVVAFFGLWDLEGCKKGLGAIKSHAVLFWPREKRRKISMLNLFCITNGRDFSHIVAPK